jgi:hypothetical protein
MLYVRIAFMAGFAERVEHGDCAQAGFLHDEDGHARGLAAARLPLDAPDGPTGSRPRLRGHFEEKISRGSGI